MTTVSVLVPYRPDGAERSAVWEWLVQRWTKWIAVDGRTWLEVGGDGGDGEMAEEGVPFSRTRAINSLAARTIGDVFVIADADTAFDPAWLASAVDAVTSPDGPAWVLPSQYRKLTEAATRAALGSTPYIDLSFAECEWIGNEICWSGMIVVRREAFEAVGGFDERFHRWGEDDTSFAAAISTLVEPVTRIPGACYHLWHPTSLEETYGAEGFAEMRVLAQRYLDAWGDPDEMRKVRFDA